MPKLLNRVVTSFIVASLIADPAMASGFSYFLIRDGYFEMAVNQSLFCGQALATLALGFNSMEHQPGFVEVNWASAGVRRDSFNSLGVGKTPEAILLSQTRYWQAYEEFAQGMQQLWPAGTAGPNLLGVAGSLGRRRARWGLFPEGMSFEFATAVVLSERDREGPSDLDVVLSHTSDEIWDRLEPLTHAIFDKYRVFIHAYPFPNVEIHSMDTLIPDMNAIPSLASSELATQVRKSGPSLNLEQGATQVLLDRWEKSDNRGLRWLGGPLRWAGRSYIEDIGHPRGDLSRWEAVLQGRLPAILVGVLWNTLAEGEIVRFYNLPLVAFLFVVFGGWPVLKRLVAGQILFVFGHRSTNWGEVAARGFGTLVLNLTAVGIALHVPLHRLPVDASGWVVLGIRILVAALAVAVVHALWNAVCALLNKPGWRLSQNDFQRAPPPAEPDLKEQLQFCYTSFLWLLPFNHPDAVLIHPADRFALQAA